MTAIVALHGELELIVGHWIVEGCMNFRKRRRVGAHPKYTSRLGAYFWDLWTNATTPVPSGSSTSTLDTYKELPASANANYCIIMQLADHPEKSPREIHNEYNLLNLPKSRSKAISRKIVNEPETSGFSPDFEKASPELITKATRSINWNQSYPFLKKN